MRKSAFNLVEILVAMAILTIGMVGLVGIIPISTEALANANGKLYAAEIGQSMADYIDADVNGLTAAAPSGSESLGMVFNTAAIFSAAGDATHYIGNQTAITPSTCSFPSAFTGWSSTTTGLTKCPDVNILYADHPWFGTVYTCSSVKGLYRIVRKSDSVGGVQDFSALACIWFVDSNSTESTQIPLNGGAVLALPRANVLCAMVEVNWPGNLTPEINRAAGRSLTLQRFIRVR